ALRRHRAPPRHLPGRVSAGERATGVGRRERLPPAAGDPRPPRRRAEGPALRRPGAAALAPGDHAPRPGGRPGAAGPALLGSRLTGHCGTSTGLSLGYVHLNRLIRERDANVIYLAGPGHGGPAILANVYLEGAYSEVYPVRVVPTDEDVMIARHTRALLRGR